MELCHFLRTFVSLQKAKNEGRLHRIKNMLLVHDMTLLTVLDDAVLLNAFKCIRI